MKRAGVVVVNHFTSNYKHGIIKTCWKCKKKLNLKPLYVLLFYSAKNLRFKPYDVFQLNKVYDIDKELLEERYLELQKTLHPDKFINSTDIERDISNSQTSFVNNAYELLENDISRVKILLKLKNYNMNDENAI